MRELIKRKKKPVHNDADFIEALGDVIGSARRLQSGLLRTAMSGEVVSETCNQKLQSDLLRRVGNLDLVRDLAEFDQALKRVEQARPSSLEEMTHPLLTLK